jgi:UDP-glucose 4-epimerase
MTRFLLTLNEAVKLALKCLHEGTNGDLYVIKSPASKVKTIVEAFELYFNKPIPTKVIGVRPGEKMHETLLTSDEVHRSIIDCDNNIVFAKVPPLAKNLGDFYFVGEDYKEPEAFTSSNTEQYNAEQVLNKIKEAKLL